MKMFYHGGKKHSCIYPQLSRLTSVLLSIPASGATSEWIFSRARNGPQKCSPTRPKAARIFSRPARPALNLAQSGPDRPKKFSRPARPGPGPKDIFYYRDLFPIEFENHVSNHQVCWEQITSVIKNMIRLDYPNYNAI